MPIMAYRYRLYPTDEQITQIERTFGCVRYIYNAMLDRQKKAYARRKEHLSCNDMQNLLPGMKQYLPWLRDVDSQALQQACRNLDAAYKRFFEKQARFPRFKAKSAPKQSYTTTQISVLAVEAGRVKLPKLGWVKAKTTRLPTGKIKRATVSRNARGKYFVSVAVEEAKEQLPRSDKAVGADLGYRALATLSDGTVPNTIRVQDELGRKCIMTVGKRGTRKVNGDDVDCLHIMGVSNSIPVTPSFYDEQEWRCINVEGNNYKKYFLRQVPGGLQASYGSIDVPKDRCKQVKALYPSLLFYALDAEKRSKGYVNVTEFTNAGNVQQVANDPKTADHAAPKTANEELYQFLLMMSKRVADRTISTPAADITEKMVIRARQALATMKAAMEADDLDGFCSAQEDLMLMLPHKRDPMQGDKIRDYLPRKANEMPTVWDAEEARINAADALVSNKSTQAEHHAADFKQFGVHVWKATAEQKADVLSRINPANRRFVKEIWRVKPDAQVAKFEAYKKAHNIYGSGNSDGSDLGVQHYFHGSDNANWFSILKDNGLRNMPAVHGRMFGDLDGTACYYAPSFDKAGGYQSSSTRWNSGSSRTGIVGMFAVCMGKPMYVTRPGCYTKKDLARQGKNSVYAKAGQTGLRADEVVAEMSCLEYLIVSEV